MPSPSPRDGTDESYCAGCGLIRNHWPGCTGDTPRKPLDGFGFRVVKRLGATPRERRA